VLFPDGEDPDSFAKKNSPLFVKSYIKDEAKDFLSFKIAVLHDEVKGDPIKTAEMIREIIQSLALIPDPIIRAVYLKECAMRLEIAEQTLINELNKLVTTGRKKEYEKQQRAQENTHPDDTTEDPFIDVTSGEAPITEVKQLGWAQERDLIRILMKYANQLITFQQIDEENRNIEAQIRVGDFVINELLNDGLLPENADLLRIFDLFVGITEGDFPDDTFFMHHEDELISKIAIDLCSEQHVLSVHWKEMHDVYIAEEIQLLKKMVLGAIYSFKLRKVQVMLDVLNGKINSNNPEEEMMQALEEIMMLQKAKMELAKQLSYVIL
jgi:DNA primase